MRPILLAFTGFLLTCPVLAQSQTIDPVVMPGETMVVVEGEGSISVEPARMRVSIGVVTTAATAAQALEANNRKLGAVVEMLRQRGIDRTDIQTEGFSVEPEFDNRRDNGDGEIIRFRAENTLRVTTGDLVNAGTLVSNLFDAGANTITGPYFLVAEEDELRLARQAEVAALREARAQAETIAEALGMKVSRVITVSERRVRFRENTGNIVVVTASSLAPTSIEPGEISVSATYNVVFALEAL